jgi:hypothetical protein
MVVLRRSHILQLWIPGSRNWSWTEEFNDILAKDYQRVIELCTDISINGILEPIILGSDHRVWEGHHRLLVSGILGIECLPTQFGYVDVELEDVYEVI